MVAPNFDNCQTPAIVYSIASLRASARQLREACDETSCRLFFSPKSCSITAVLEVLNEYVDGFSVSSGFEARLVHQIAWGAAQTQLISPNVESCLQASDISYQYVVFNSLNQCRRLKGVVLPGVRWGVRLNPEYSIADDLRFDPCQRHSKLGVRSTQLMSAWRANCLDGISGIHFHTACCSNSWEPLLHTVRVVEKLLSPMLCGLEWINVGGGYLWDETTDFGPFQEAVNLLTKKYDLQVFVEPGAGIVNSAGYLVASVIDLFKSDGKMIAVLDTAVNHLPEVFEYQYEPDVVEHVDNAPHEYILAGCSCLAGDLFGEYSFEHPLEIGSRVTFANVGAYSLVKAHMFNGINLPNIYTLTEEGELVLVKRFTYEDYASRCGVDTHATFGT